MIDLFQQSNNLQDQISYVERYDMSSLTLLDLSNEGHLPSCNGTFHLARTDVPESSTTIFSNLFVCGPNCTPLVIPIPDQYLERKLLTRRHKEVQLRTFTFCVWLF